MGAFYFDESIHERGNFILGGFIYATEDPDQDIANALVACGLDPVADEFKSSCRMSDHPEQIKLRRALRSIMNAQFRIGVVVAAASDRAAFGKESLVALAKIITANNLDTSSQSAYFDEGLFSSVSQAEAIASELQLVSRCELHFEQDSRRVRGIQLADLVAHTCATMLLETLGLVTKKVKAGPSSGYDPDLELDLGFELWAGIRYQFFSGGFPKNVETNEDMVVDVESYGLHIGDSVSEHVRDAALRRFAKCYLGCIH